MENILQLERIQTNYHIHVLTVQQFTLKAECKMLKESRDLLKLHISPGDLQQPFATVDM